MPVLIKRHDQPGSAEFNSKRRYDSGFYKGKRIYRRLWNLRRKTPNPLYN
jgi:hypothetical protein